MVDLKPQIKQVTQDDREGKKKSQLKCNIVCGLHCWRCEVTTPVSEAKMDDAGTDLILKRSSSLHIHTHT